MKTVCVIPIKKTSKRVKSKNFLLINKRPLYTFLLDKLTKSNFDEIYVDSDSNEIESYCKKKGYKFINRKPYLKKDNANGNDLILYHQKLIKSDLYFQLFVTAPLLSINSINESIKFLKKTKKYDSILTCYEQYSWTWFSNKPVNYKPNVLPRSQDAKPIIIESTGLYGIKNNALKKYQCRIGRIPYFYKIDEIEGLDIDSKLDIEKLRFYIKNVKNIN